MRKTGIHLITHAPWGTHLCQFYQTKEDLTDILVPYFKAGLENNEFCMWVTSEPLEVNEAKASLEKVVKNLDDYIDKGQIEILEASQWYTKFGKFDPDEALQGWVEKEKQGVRRGFDGLRLAGNTFWLEDRDWKDFVNYEATIDSIIGEHRMIAICSYCLDKCGASEITDVVSNHRFSLIRREGGWELIESTEHKRSEEALARSEAKYRRLVENINDGYMVVTLEGKIVFANAKMAQLLGCELKELIGEDVMKFTPPKFIPYVEKLRQRVEQRRRVRERLEGAFLNKDGEPVLAEMSMKAIEYEGEPALAVIVRDITERKRAEEALRESEQKYRQVFEATLDGMIVIDAETMRVVLANQAAVKMMGFDSIEGVSGVNLLDFVPADERERVLKIIVKDMFENDLRHVNEFRTITKDGREIWLAALGTRTEYEGRLAGLVSFRDITKRKRAEEALRDSEEMSRGMLESAATGIYIVQEGKFQYVSPLFEEISGYTSEELIGTYSFGYVHPEDRKAVRKKAIENLKGQSSSPHEFRFIRKDGQPVWVLEQVASIQYKGERAAVGSFMDITERKRAEEAIARDTKRMEALHAFAQTVSQTLDLEEMLDSAVERVKEAMEADAATISVVDTEAKEVVIKAHIGLSEGFVASAGRLKLDEEEVERIMGWREQVAPSESVLNQANQATLMAAAEKEGLQSSLTVPVVSKRFFIGSVTVASRHPREFTHEDVDLLTSIANQIAVGIENASLFAEVSRSATTDGLTGLYNHRYFQERLEEEVARVVRFGGECSLIMLDLDHFKIYNDLFGHVAGDEVLKRIGQILCDYTREVDIACRYGGEEFVLILPQTGSADAYQAAERLRQAAEAALSLEGGTEKTPVTISLGVASCPGDGVSREALVHSADLAMREAKERGRNQTCLVSELASAAPAEGEVSWEVAEHLEAASLNTIYALAAAVDARDHYTYGHSRQVAKYAVAIGKALGLSRRKLERLRIAALLHDIGKIGLSDSVIKKPGPLDEKEWEMMRKHPRLGATIISHTPELADCAPSIQHHHEWQDGSGYPNGLKGEDIPLEARIIAIADAYDTMTTPRAYRETLSQKEAVEELRRCANTQFDPQLVETFARVVNSAVVSTA